MNDITPDIIIMAEVKAVSPVKEIPDRVHAVAGRENVRSESEKETENVTASGIGDGEAGRGEGRAGGGGDILLGNLTVETSTGLENENENGNADLNEELDEPQDEDTRQYLSGWKLHMLTIGSVINLYLHHPSPVPRLSSLLYFLLSLRSLSQHLDITLPLNPRNDYR